MLVSNIHWFSSILLAPRIGFDPVMYNVDENARVVDLVITTSDPSAFTDSTGALFYTNPGSAGDFLVPLFPVSK